MMDLIKQTSEQNKNIEEKYFCKACCWQGTNQELESEKAETCIGDDAVEVCPKCGSMEVYRILV